MEYQQLPDGTKIPALGIGTWRMGGGLFKADYSQDHLYIVAIRRAIAAGLTHIDTAEIYGAGHTEELVGKSIKGFNRKKLFITTKISPHHLFTQSQIARHAHASLIRLNIDYIDLYLLHAPNPLVSPRRAIVTFDKLIDKKLVRFIGVSNFSLSQLKQAIKYSKYPIVTNQVHYNLLNRDCEEKLLPFCQKESVILTAYSPLAQGQIVSGRIRLLDEVARKYHKTAPQVAIRWLIDKPNVITIPKVTTKAHLDEILGSLGWHLAKGDKELLPF